MLGQKQPEIRQLQESDEPAFVRIREYYNPADLYRRAGQTARAEQKQDIAAARSLLAKLQQMAAQDDSLSHEARYLLPEADRRWGLPQA